MTNTNNQSSSSTVLLDLNHPSHFHFFKEFILGSRINGIDIYITARERKYLNELLKAYNIPYISKGKRRRSFLGKFSGLLKEVFQLYLLTRAIKPDMFLSFASPYAAIAGKLLGKPVVTFDDTEGDVLLHQIYPRFSDLIITPECFQKSFGKKHIRFRGYKESVYLRKINEGDHGSLMKDLNIAENETFILVRFVSRSATHEMGHKGLRQDDKIKLVNELSKHGKVIISSEATLPQKLQRFGPDIPVERMHEVLKRANLFFGESATMAAEAALLGTPVVLIENSGRGYIEDLEKKTGWLGRFSTHEQEKALQKAKDILKGQKYDTSESKHIIESILNDTTDIKALLKWIMEDPQKNTAYLKRNPQQMEQFVVAANR